MAGGKFMKNTKLVAGIAGIITLLLGLAVKGKETTDFQNKLSKIVKVDTVTYIADNKTIGRTPQRKTA